MAITLAEAAKLSTDMMVKGVMETIIRESPILQNLPFIEIVGNALTYNRERTLPGAAWYNPNETWAAPTPPTFDQVSTTLRILGEHADVDNYIKQTRSNVQDIEAVVIELTAKAIRYEFERTFINGLGTATAKDFMGIDAMVPVDPVWTANTARPLGYFCRNTGATWNGWRYEVTTAGTTGATEPTWPRVEGATVTDGTVVWTCRRSQLVMQSDATGATANGGVLTLAKLDELIDKILGGKPDMLLMSRRSRRRINALVRASGGMMETDRNQWGEFIQRWNGIQIGINDFISDAQTVGTSTDCSTIYAMQFGEGALCGLSGPGLIQVEPVGQLEARDATRTRIKWYCSLALFSQVKLAKLIGVRD